jgi:hypothetical protein
MRYRLPVNSLIAPETCQKQTKRRLSAAFHPPHGWARVTLPSSCTSMIVIMCRILPLNCWPNHDNCTIVIAARAVQYSLRALCARCSRKTNPTRLRSSRRRCRTIHSARVNLKGSGLRQGLNSTSIEGFVTVAVVGGVFLIGE